MSLVQKLYPRKEIYDSYNYRQQRQVHNLALGDLLLSFCFFIFSVALVAMQFFITGIAFIVPWILFLVSTLIIRKGKIKAASNLSTIGLLISISAVAFFIAPSESSLVIFRLGLFCAVTAVLNFVISLSTAQIIIFFIGSIVFIIAGTFGVYGYNFTTPDFVYWTNTFVSSFLGVVALNAFLYSAFKSNLTVVKHSETANEKSEASLKVITNVLGQVKSAVDVGKKLNEAADVASHSVTQINADYNELMQDTDLLESQSSNVKMASDIVTRKTSDMSKFLQEENNALTEMSSAMTQISTNISNISEIAEKRRAGMSEVINELNTLGELIKKIVSEIEMVKSSSEEISKFVETINDISEQTNLLAMNASIEAAHAGETGKGFSVIAQEIRKLSEETSRNAAKISDTLQHNNAVVNETSDSVNEFARQTTKSSDEIRNTLGSMEEILSGIQEMDAGTQDVMKSVSRIVSQSDSNQKIIRDVVEQIDDQSKSIGAITDSTSSVKSKVSTMHELIGSFADIVDEVHSSAMENEIVSARIAELLK